ncbi:MAG: DUF2273 domain-containing protein [Patescibacteria group bacterium]
MDTESVKHVLAYLAARKGRLVGAFLGFVTGIIWAFLGWWRAAIFLFCVALGYFIGLRLDRKDTWREIVAKILPPSE